MEYRLYCDKSKILRTLEANAGIDDAMRIAEEPRHDGIDVRIIDTSTMADKELQAIYGRAIAPSVYKRYRIRKIFGTNRYAGCSFGRGVPALLAQESERSIVEDVFPHEEPGKLVTIRDALMKAMQPAPFAVEGKSALRGMKARGS
ncbi:MAG: hypothetical protein ACREQI_04985 [Candidatus Binataceae bacterium]